MINGSAITVAKQSFDGANVGSKGTSQGVRARQHVLPHTVFEVQHSPEETTEVHTDSSKKSTRVAQIAIDGSVVGAAVGNVLGAVDGTLVVGCEVGTCVGVAVGVHVPHRMGQVTALIPTPAEHDAFVKLRQNTRSSSL
jgi:hypothetical protein